jgi:hypothetical protein
MTVGPSRLSAPPGLLASRSLSRRSFSRSSARSQLRVYGATSTSTIFPWISHLGSSSSAAPTPRRRSPRCAEQSLLEVRPQRGLWPSRADPPRTQPPDSWPTLSHSLLYGAHRWLCRHPLCSEASTLPSVQVNTGPESCASVNVQVHNVLATSSRPAAGRSERPKGICAVLSGSINRRPSPRPARVEPGPLGPSSGRPVSTIPRRRPRQQQPARRGISRWPRQANYAESTALSVAASGIRLSSEPCPLERLYAASQSCGP